MVILERNIRLVLLSVAYESGKTMAQPETTTKVSDIAILVITVMLFAIFVVGVASVCYRWRSRQLNSLESELADSSVESRTMSARRNFTVARGINADIIKSFPAFLYSEVKERRIGKGGVECAVCLCEFEDDETLRLMPICCHVFHADCVSVWLSDHSTCPLCRMDLLFQPGERSDEIPVLDLVDYTDAQLDGVTWTNRNRQPRSMSTRLSYCRVAEILLSRSHSTGHPVVQPVENLDRFTLRLPEDVQRQLKKKMVDHVDVASTQVRSSRRGYRSKSAGDESSVFSYQRNNYNNNRRLHSMTFSGCAELWSTSGSGDVVAPLMNLSRSIHSGEQLFQPDERV